MTYYNRLNRSTARPKTETPTTPQPTKQELYTKIWERHVQQPTPASTILQEVIDTCNKLMQKGADYYDVLTAAIAAQGEDAVNDATSGVR